MIDFVLHAYTMLTYCVSGVVKEELISLNVWEHLSEVESKCYPAQVLST